ncbi:MAG TPA: VWA domain-containing protein [bacterium]|nr:VWA domain-containing protein [bacterium]
MVEKAPGRPARPENRAQTGPDGTNLADALQVAASLAPAGYGTRIVVISDGRENTGNALREADALLAAGVELDLLPLHAAQGDEAAIEELELPHAVKQDQPFLARLVLYSDAAQELQLGVKRNHQQLGAYSYRHPGGGARLVTIPLRAETEGFVHYRFQLDAAHDRIAQNNVQEAFLEIATAPRVLLVAAAPTELGALPATLAAAKIDAQVVSPSGIPPALAELRAYDAVLLADIPATDLGERMMSMLKAYVQDAGGGLLMLGGPNSFGAGGYYKTPVEEVLPVTMDLRNRRQMPLSAIVLLIDKSGSMSMTMDGLEKIEIAKKASVLAAELLGNEDYIGVIGFDGEAKEVVPFDHLMAMDRVEQTIGTLRAGGGTNIMPALEMAAGWLKQLPRMNKHIILLSDGCTAGGDYDRMARELVRQGITVTTVAIGTDANNDLMMAIADNGGGRYYVANRLTEIPRIFTRETMLTAKNVICEKPFTPVPGMPAEILNGLDARALPGLAGYVLTTPKPNAEVPLLALEDDPLLATTRSGLGKAVAWTSDASPRWAAGWLAAPAYPQFWEQAVRWSLPDLVPGNVRHTIQHDGNRVSIELEVRENDGNYSNFRDLGMVAAGPRGELLRGALHQRGPGRYAGELELPARGSYLLTVVEHAPDGERALLRTGIGHTYSPEYRQSRDDAGVLPRLRQFPGVREVREPAELFRPLRRPAHRIVEVWQPLVLLAVILFVIEIAVRRVDFRLAEVVAALRGRAPAVTEGMVTTVTRLRAIKTKAEAAQPRPTLRPLPGLSRSAAPRVTMPTTTDPAVPSSPAPEETSSAAPAGSVPPAGETATGRLLAARRRAREQLTNKSQEH